jgi:hypothetical protein
MVSGKEALYVLHDKNGGFEALENVQILAVKEVLLVVREG